MGQQLPHTEPVPTTTFSQPEQRKDEVTSEMIAAGVEIIAWLDGQVSKDFLAREVWEAMESARKLGTTGEP